MRRLFTLLAAVLLAGLGMATLAVPASAHNVLINTSPKAGSAVATGPPVIQLDFDAPVEQGENNITVLGPDGTHWERSETAKVVGNSVTTEVAPLGPAGVYTASYRIISADGHPVTGDVKFRLTRPGSGQPVPVAASPSGGGGIPIWVWIVVAVVVLGAVLFFVLRSGGPKEESGQ